ncbi:hypothetical protein [Flavobacterium succinicans]|nr:hypothetical protein [Flavobacterium succinicans]
MEESITKANAENKEKLEEKLTEVKAEVVVKKDEFVAKAELAKAEIKITHAKNSFKEKIAQIEAHAKARKLEIEAKIANAKHHLDLKFAEADYNDAVDYAQNCIDWAEIALGDVQEAILEALTAQNKYEHIKNAS